MTDHMTDRHSLEGFTESFFGSRRSDRAPLEVTRIDTETQELVVEGWDLEMKEKRYERRTPLSAWRAK